MMLLHAEAGSSPPAKTSDRSVSVLLMSGLMRRAGVHMAC